MTDTGYVDYSPVSKSLGALMTTTALVITAMLAPMPLWQAVAVGLIAWFGLYKMVGLKIRWRYP